jgi:hypothetical protein
MSPDEIKADIATLLRQLRVERDHEQVALLQFDMAILKKRLAEAEKAHVHATCT